MGKIIKNNVTYGGVPDEVITAWETEDVQDLPELAYGDSDISGIGDGSITGAIAEHESDISTLNSKTTWKFLDKKTGHGNPISYSSITFSELLVIVNIGDSGNKESFYIPKAELTGTNWWRAGGYTTLQTPALVTISTSVSSVQLTDASQATTDYSSTSTISVYYR